MDVCPKLTPFSYKQKGPFLQLSARVKFSDCLLDWRKLKKKRVKSSCTHLEIFLSAFSTRTRILLLLKEKAILKRTARTDFKGALSRYSVIFCAILLWGKIMAAVRFSMVAVLHTIRLCVDDRLDAGSLVRGRPMSLLSVQLLRHERWHRSGFASCCWSKRVDLPICQSLSISLAVDTGRSQFADNTFRVLCRQALLWAPASRGLVLSLTPVRETFRNWIWREQSCEEATRIYIGRVYDRWVARLRCSDFYQAGAAIGLIWCGLGGIGAIFLPQKIDKKSLNSVTVHL